MDESINVFIAYARKGLHFLKELEKHLKPLMRSDLIKIWYDRAINPGSDWKKAIDDHIDASHLIGAFAKLNALFSQLETLSTGWQRAQNAPRI